MSGVVGQQECGKMWLDRQTLPSNGPCWPAKAVPLLGSWKLEVSHGTEEGAQAEQDPAGAHKALTRVHHHSSECSYTAIRPPWSIPRSWLCPPWVWGHRPQGLVKAKDKSWRADYLCPDGAKVNAKRQRWSVGVLLMHRYSRS